MIQKLEIAGVHFDVDEKTRQYTERKLGQLDRYLPKHSRESVHLIVKLKQGKAKGGTPFTCEVIMHLPQETITIKETSASIRAAVDVAEEKVKIQFKKYKQKHTDPKFYRQVLLRFKHDAA